MIDSRCGPSQGGETKFWPSNKKGGQIFGKTFLASERGETFRTSNCHKVENWLSNLLPLERGGGEVHNLKLEAEWRWRPFCVRQRLEYKTGNYVIIQDTSPNLKGSFTLVQKIGTALPLFRRNLGIWIGNSLINFKIVQICKVIPRPPTFTFVILLPLAVIKCDTLAFDTSEIEAFN